jgi:hypothetical protein
MQYFHRTSLPPEQVIEAAQRFFGARLAPAEETARRLAYGGAIGKVALSVLAEGGHYTLVQLRTDQLAESELDRLAKRFLAEVHRLAEPAHQVRGAY